MTLRSKCLALLIGLISLAHAGESSSTLEFASNPTAVPNPARRSQSVTFTAAVANPGKRTLNYTWDFGDGASMTGSVGTHAYVSAGTYTVSVTVSDGTLSTKESLSLVVSRNAALVGEGPDGDADGFSDRFETATALDPFDIKSTPLSGAPADINTIQALNLNAANIALSFDGKRPDSITLSGTIPLAEGMKLDGQKVYLDVGGVSRVLTLDAKGNANQSGGSFKLSAAKSSRSARADADSASYSMVFTSTWSNKTHPHPTGNFPAGAHYSPLIGAVHNSQSAFWTPGVLASVGIEQMAELGATAGLKNEFTTAGANVSSVIEGSGLGSATGTVNIPNITVTRDHPLVTLVTMVAPTPDWFTGVAGLSMLDDAGQWRDEIEVTVYPWDSGSDNGPDYTSADIEATPHQPIFSLKGVAPFSAEPLGTFKFTRKGIVPPTPGNPPAVATINAKFALKLSGDDFEKSFVDEGMSADESLRKAARSVVISMVVNNTIYQKTQTLSYSARKGTGIGFIDSKR